MAKRNNTFKQIVVREHPVQSLFEAGLYGLDLQHGDRLIVIGNLLFPNHDEGEVQMVIKHIKDSKARTDLIGRRTAVIILGPAVDEEAAKSLWNREMNFIHTQEDPEVVKQALKQRGFDRRMLYFWKQCGKFVRRFAPQGVTMFYFPSHINLGLPNEHDMFEDAHTTKRVLDTWTANHPDATDSPSSLGITLPERIDEAFGLTGVENVQVMPFGAGILVNEKTLVTIGAFRRRHAGDAPIVEWEQTGYNVIIGVDGKSSSAWWTDVTHTMPEPVYRETQVHQVGYLWDRTRNGHLGGYHRRSPSFFSGVMGHGGELHGRVSPFRRGNDGRRSVVIAGRTYTEDSPGCLPNGGNLTLTAAQTGEKAETPAPRDGAEREAEQYRQGKRNTGGGKSTRSRKSSK